MQKPQRLSNEVKRYWAFVSYSHSDTRETEWLHRALEKYKIPGYLIGTETRNGVVPRRIFPVFRDRDELPTSSNLGDNLHSALKNSRYLIVVCSPRSAKSVWVDAEVNYFKKVHGESNVLCLIVGGTPGGAGDGESAECFCPSLKFRVGTDGELTNDPVEPIAADLRDNKDGRRRAFLKIAAGVLGVDFDTLYQRDKKRRRNRIIGFFVATGVAALVVAGIYIRLGKITRTQNEMESQVRQMKESKFREFGSLPEQQTQKLQQIISDSGIFAIESELPPIVEEQEKRFQVYTKTLESKKELAEERFARLVTEKNNLIRKLEGLLEEIKPAEGWVAPEGNALYAKNDPIYGFDSILRRKIILDENFQKEEEKFRNRKGIYADLPGAFASGRFDLVKMSYQLDSRNNNNSSLPKYEKAFQDSAQFSNKGIQVKEIANGLLMLIVDYQIHINHSESEKLKSATTSIAGLQLGSDGFNFHLQNYKAIAQAIAKQNVEDYVRLGDSNDFGESTNDEESIAKWEAKILKCSEQIGIRRKSLTPEESVVFEPLLNSMIDNIYLSKNQSIDKIRGLRLKFEAERKKNYEQLIEVRLLATGWGSGSPMINSEEQIKKAESQANKLSQRDKASSVKASFPGGFAEKIWNRPRNRMTEGSIEVLCISRFLFKREAADGVAELDEERIRMAQQFALLISTALWVD